MNNQEKAIEILSGFDPLGALIEMAEWKDQQFKEYLEEKLGKYAGGELVYAGVFINDIINELFGETEHDNSDREE